MPSENRLSYSHFKRSVRAYYGVPIDNRYMVKMYAVYKEGKGLLKYPALLKLFNES